MTRPNTYLLRPEAARTMRLELFQSLLAAAAFVPVVLHFGWREPVLGTATAWAIVMPTLLVYCLVTLFPPGSQRWSVAALSRGVRANRSLLLLASAGIALSWLAPVLAFVPTLLILIHLLKLFLAIVQTRIPPGLVFVGSFIGLIAIGTTGLLLPAATPSDQPINILDATFTITSAISQTGLVVRDTGTSFTRFGQVIILIWIQVGALGVIVFGALLATMLGSGFSLRATQTLAEPTEQGWSGALSLRNLVVFIIVVTHIVELIGAVVLYFSWPDNWAGAPQMASVGDRVFHSVFFSVSSFCNAGFATSANSLQGLRGHWVSHGVIVPLIVIGSIGFPVLDNMWRVVWSKIRGVRIHRGGLIRLNLNTKLVLVTTLGVYLLGYVFIVLGELTQTQEPLRLVMLDAHFMTINRTSGFDTIAPESMGLLSRLTLILVMFIGGSPGSVAGGIKMMVFAVLLLTVWSTILGREEVHIFGRTIPETLIRKSATLIVLSLATVMATTGVLAATMEISADGTAAFSLDELLFEATSAFGTTGFSMGVTTEAPTPARIALMAAMFVGRVGPLAVLAALLSITKRGKPRIEYPTEDVVIY